jgi:cell wall-associated NlpC family hydrolase
VTIYLGDGQMLEAPDIGLKVRVAPVRTSGMTPYVVRYIEY